MKLQRFTTHTDLTDYMPLPRSLLKQKLNSGVLLLYAILLDRGTLSRKNSYADASGWVYVLYTQEELAQMLCISTRMVQRYLSVLENKGLLRRYKEPRTKANRYYLLIPDDSAARTNTGQICHPFRTDLSSDTRHGCHPNNLKEQPDSNNTYQHSEDESL